MKRCYVASVVLFDKLHKKVVLVHHKKLGVWMYPGGHVEEGEFPHEAALREVMEETGLHAKFLKDQRTIKEDDFARQVKTPFAVLLEDVPYKDEHHEHCDFIYVAETKNDALQLNEEEATEIRWFDAEGVRNVETFENIRQMMLAAFSEFGV